MYIPAILTTVQTKLRGKLKLCLNLGICGSGMLRVVLRLIPARQDFIILHTCTTNTEGETHSLLSSNCLGVAAAVPGVSHP